MNDEISMIRNSKIQHGNSNNRIYIMKLAKNDLPDILYDIDLLAKKNKYSKVFGKIPSSYKESFIEDGYIQEAIIPRFYDNEEDLLFLSKFLSHSRKNEGGFELINDIIKMSVYYKENQKKTIPHKHDYNLRLCIKNDIPDMVMLYSIAFKTYPFPIHDESYIREVMDSHVDFYGIWNGEELISLASVEKDRDSNTVEMTDFVTKVGHRGKGLAKQLLKLMEEKVRDEGCNICYTIARARSPGMNKVFGSLNYIYGGTLVNNTQISGGIESMNVWYKNIRGIAR